MTISVPIFLHLKFKKIEHREGNMEQNTYIKNRIAMLLSEILSDKYECKVTLRFEKKEQEQWEES